MNVYLSTLEKNDKIVGGFLKTKQKNNDAKLQSAFQE